MLSGFWQQDGKFLPPHTANNIDHAQCVSAYLCQFLQYKIADKLVFSKLKEKLGGQMRFMISGSAKLSPQVQELAQQFSGRVQCRVGDAEHLEFGGPFDAVLSASTVQWFADIPAFFARCAGVLPKGGLLAFSSFLPGNLQEVAELTGVGLTYGSAAQLQGQLAPHFELLAMEQSDITLRFASPRHVLLHLRHTGVTGIRSVVWGKNSYKDFVARYTARYGNEQGVRLTYRPVYVLAKSKGMPCGKP